VVDQLEGIFTECRDEQERQGFITALCALARRFVVVLALRADFYDHTLRYPELATSLQKRQVVLPPMSRDQVRRAICEPARLAALEVEDGLVEILLRDLAPQAPAGSMAPAHEAGALPLLSHALLATWEYSRSGRLTIADYLASGGIREAIARTAEKVFDSLDEAQQDMARRFFLRLVQVSDETPVTRMPVALRDLDNVLGGLAAGDLLARFVDERLITVGAETAQITHDALLTAWPRLQEWIEAGHENLRIRRHISQAARAWVEAGKDDADLLRGGRLSVARDWAATSDNHDSLDGASREFLNAAVAAEQARQQADRAQTHRLRRLVAGLTALAVATLALAGYAFQQRHTAIAARDTATTARDVAESRGTAIEADQQRGLDPSLAAQLSLAAYQIAPTAQSRASLLESSGTPAATRLIDSTEAVQAVSLSRDRQVLAVAAQDGTLRLWNVSRPGHPVRLGPTLAPPGSNPLYAVSFSPNGRILAAAGAAKSVALWNVTNPGRPARIGHTLTGPRNTVYSVAFSPNGRLLAAGSADDTVRVWDIKNVARPALLATLTGFAGYVNSVAFSPDGQTLAAGSNDKTVRLWNMSNPKDPSRLGKPLTGPAKEVLAVAFNPGGTVLAAGSKDDKVWLWNVANPSRATQAGSPLTGAANWVNTVAFGPGGTTIAAGSSDDTVRMWNLATRQPTATLPLPQPVTTLSWDGSGHLISGDADGTARIWSLPPPILFAGGRVNSVAYSPDGQLLAVGGDSLELWDAASRQLLASSPAPATLANAVAFSHRGILAAGYGNGTVQLWRASAIGLVPLERPFLASAIGSAATDLVESVSFSPDGAILATGGDDGTIRLWSVSDPAHPQLLVVIHDSGQTVFSVAFSPNGTTLAAASADALTRLWDVSDPAKPQRIGPLLRGPAKIAISVAFSPDGDTLAVGGADGTVHLWDIQRPSRPQPLGPPLTGPSGYVYSLAFSANGKTLAGGVTDDTVWLWRIANPARPSLIATLTGPAQQVFSITFSPNGQTLAAGSYDGTVRLWDTSLQAAASAICATAGQPLTKREWATYMPGLPYHVPCAA
jgi:WD40 repeat protein